MGRGSQGIRHVYTWATQDKRAPNLVGKPCVLMSQELFDELLFALRNSQEFIEGFEDVDNTDTNAAVNALLRDSRDAIAKATGSTS